jgi:hypothetical protein
MLRFFVDLVNGAIDFAQAANTGVGDFVSGPLAEMIDGLATAIDWMNGLGERPKELDDLANSMRGFSGTTEQANAKLEQMRGEFNEFADAQVALGLVHDAAMATADAVGQVGVASDGTATSGEALAGQVRAAIEALEAEIAAADAAGESQDALASRYTTTRSALMDQLTAMDLTKAEAAALVDTFGQIPGEKSTEISAPGVTSSRQYVEELDKAIEKLPKKKRSEVRAALKDGDIPTVLAELGKVPKTKIVTVTAKLSGSADGFALLRGDSIRKQADGAVLEYMARGGLTSMQPLAQMVPPSTWRVVGDRSDVPELYAPLDGSARSWALILEGLRRMPGSPPQLMADGGLTGPLPASSPQVAAPITFNAYGVDAAELAARQQAQLEHYRHDLAVPRR